MSNGVANEPPNWKFPLLLALSLGLLGAVVYQYTQINQMREEVAGLRDSIQQDLAKLREASSVTTQSNRRTINSLRDELEGARRQASLAAGQAKVDANKHAEELAKALKVEQARVAEQTAKVSTELAATKETLSSAESKIGEVSTDVGNVKTEVASTKSELDKTIAELKSVRGDLGVESGKIATNGRELAALRALGERNYFEFNITKAKEAQKVGDVMVQLKKVDTKRNKYTIELVADDKRLEKKDKTVNEPVQFYVSKAKQPYELVVNEVRKDQIAGYLATPKVQQARN